MNMKTIDKSMVEEIMIFHDIYPDKELPEIEDKISKLDRDKTISIICELQETLNYQFTVPKWNLVLPFETVLKKGLYGIETSIFSNLGTKEGIEYGRKHIITSNLLIWLLKYTLAYGIQYFEYIVNSRKCCCDIFYSIHMAIAINKVFNIKCVAFCLFIPFFSQNKS